ncbi:ABC transporter ATP-binding protein [Actinomadura sp. NEAU-AAG7]|uniref:ABC transporter ATP-binding protein n=1 Tax=Actinomadura sp. NEAU-AAG7 TaxID=2839640 RepID=UPI001BE41F52|nr:ABC transporter ATP-binding protein [Actinomadura sp. NEAU-AAG7]MBT2211171.1 ABC transporter ATP-binding protein [Actinomadura sp. NEAU-AAG7]
MSRNKAVDQAGASAPHGEALRLEGVRRVYGAEGNQVTALDGVSVSLPAGSFTAVMGPSGSGKSTLLQCAAGLDRPTGGRVFVDGAELAGDNEAALTRFRRQRIGFVFQQFNLLPTLTVMQNVTLPLKLAGRKVDRRHARAILERVGLGERLDHLPAELSGGQQQRVAIARALVTRPRVVFGDEPTGALDTRSARDVLALLQEAVRVYGQTVVMVTHDPVAASYADSVLFLADGRIVGHQPQPTAEAVAERMTHLADEVERQRAAAGADTGGANTAGANMAGANR